MTSDDVWDDAVAPGGFVCGVCGMPTESEPCGEHQTTNPDVDRPERCPELSLLCDFPLCVLFIPQCAAVLK